MLTTTLLLLATPTAAHPTRPTPQSCARPGTEQIDSSQPARARKLGDLPPAKQILTVYREVEGCPKPVALRDSIGTGEMK